MLPLKRQQSSSGQFSGKGEKFRKIENESQEERRITLTSFTNNFRTFEIPHGDIVCFQKYFLKS